MLKATKIAMMMVKILSNFLFLNIEAVCMIT